MPIGKRLLFILCGFLLLLVIGYLIYTGNNLPETESEDSPGISEVNTP